MSEKNILHCQGLPCPQPVIKLKKLLEELSPLDVEIVVDNEPALENVTRFLSSRGYGHTHERIDALWHIHGRRDVSPTACEPLSNTDLQDMYDISTPSPLFAEAKILVILPAPVIGSGDDELGERLMKNFLATLPEMGSSLWRLIMLNGGVRLATEESNVIDELRALEAAGVSILVCGTCLEHYKLLNKKAVGETTNMLDIVTSMQLASTVIRI